MFKIRLINSQAEEEIKLVAERMQKTLIDVMGETKGSTFYSIEWLVERVHWHIKLEENAAIFICENASKTIVAQAIVRVETEEENNKSFGFFSTIYVLPEWRKKGIASLLIERVKEWCKNKHLKKITYNTAKDNQPLISLFEKVGYKVVLESEGMIKLVCDID